MDLAELAKKSASYAAIDQQVDQNSHVIGVGSGSTIVYAVERLGQLHAAGKIKITACIPTSFQAQQLILEAGLPLGTLNQYPRIDVAFDGADEVDAHLNAIKGGGACMFQEKLNVANAARFYLIADFRKDAKVLGTKWKRGVPIEVLPLAYTAVQGHLLALGAISAPLRMASAKAGPVLTDNAMFVLDADFGDALTAPGDVDAKIQGIVGVVETGLFCGRAQGVYFGMEDGGVVRVMRGEGGVCVREKVVL